MGQVNFGSGTFNNFAGIPNVLEIFGEATPFWVPSTLRDTLDCSENTVECAVKYELYELFDKFFLNVKEATRTFLNKPLSRPSENGICSKWNWIRNSSRRDNVAASFGNIDTRSSLEVFKNLVMVGNLYLWGRKYLNQILLNDIRMYFIQMLRVFGVTAYLQKLIFQFQQEPLLMYL